MKKTAVVYDKWLKTLGGGEVVACTIVQILLEKGYETTLISGSKVNVNEIRKKLNIDIKNAKMVEIWNEEKKLQEVTKNKDIFINISFMDYSVGKARHNYYYASFPTRTDSSLKTYIIENFIFPFFSKFIKPIEFINQPKITKVLNGNLLYSIDKNLKLRFSSMKSDDKYICKFSVYFPFISKVLLESIRYSFIDAEYELEKVYFDHLHNLVHFEVKVYPKSSNVVLSVWLNRTSEVEAYLLLPRATTRYPLYSKFFKSIENRIINRLRAGYFADIKNRMKHFKRIFSHSEYVGIWINKYWGLKSTTIYPPVKMISPHNKINKKNAICSVGRFFTLGHGKKQEVLIYAFKKLYDLGYRDWELHLAGGLNNEPSSIEFMKQLNDMAKGYPIYFHINISRDKIETLYLKCKIYWHATGYGENKNVNPIKMEHFGIAPIEAMSAKCYPILFNGGGLTEIIDKLKLPMNMHLFNSVEELVNITQKVIDTDLSLSSKLVDKLNTLFSKETFKERIVNQLRI